jgi:hypothetical protein
MSPFAEFLDLLLREGRAVLKGPLAPSSLPSQAPDVVDILRRAYAGHCLSVAGPPLEFDVATALAAAALVYHACWFLVSHAEPAIELERLLALRGPPGSPATHLSADLLLRFLPQVHRRAKAMNPADRLTTLLADVLRHWPLSGVLADLDEGPLVPPAFDGHAGLWMVYAERLARHEKPAWVPQGPSLAYLELVYRELGKDPAILLRAAQGTVAILAAGPVEGTDD